MTKVVSGIGNVFREFCNSFIDLIYLEKYSQVFRVRISCNCRSQNGEKDRSPYHIFSRILDDNLACVTPDKNGCHAEPTFGSNEEKNEI